MGGSATAQLNAGVTSGGTLRVEAAATGSATTKTTAGAGGLLAGQLNLADATLTTTADAHVGRSENVTLTGDVTIRGRIQGDAKVDAFGAAVGLAAVGAVIANATLSPTAIAYVGASTTLSGANVDVDAWINDSGSGPIAGKGAHATATAPSFGLVALGGAVPTAAVGSTANSYVDATATITATGAISLSALASNQANAAVTSFGGGFVSLGASIANASTHSSTRAHLEGRVTSGTDVTVTAKSVEKATSDANATSGGVVSGGATIANSTVAQNGTAPTP